MNDNNQVNGQENNSDNQPCCDGGSCCPSGSGSSGKSWKMVVFIVIVVAAGGVLAHQLVNKSKSDSAQSQQGFAVIQTDNESDAPTLPKAIKKVEEPVKSEAKIATVVEPVKSEAKVEATALANEIPKQTVTVKAAPTTISSLWKADLNSLASLDKLAADSNAVFVLLASKPPLSDMAIIKEIEAAAQKIMANKTKVSAFRLKESAPEYANLVKQVSVPSVLVMVKGLGMSAVSGDITETKLVQAFVTASRPSSCGPSGCGPSGCDPAPAKTDPKK